MTIQFVTWHNNDDCILREIWHLDDNGRAVERFTANEDFEPIGPSRWAGKSILAPYGNPGAISSGEGDSPRLGMGLAAIGENPTQDDGKAAECV